jgi:DNA mismatch repair protein MutS2
LIQAETLNLLEWPRLCQHLATFAATKLGAIAAQQLVLPEHQAESEALLAQTQEVYTLENRLASGLSFDGIQDIGEFLDRAERQAILSGKELFAIATTLAGVRNLRRCIDQQSDCPTLTALVADLRTYPELEQDIYHCIDDQGRVSDRASTKLASVREQIRTLRDQIYAKLQAIMQRHANAIQESVITQRSDRYVIPVKASHKDVIQGLVHDTSMSGATLYVEPHSLVNGNNQLRQLIRQEEREAELVRSRLTALVAEVVADLERLLAIATTLDLATARARYSLWLGANPPRFIDDLTPEQPEPTTLRGLRHPLLVWQQQHEQGLDVVPIDLSIQPSIRVIAITGPNTGGKTVTLKTFGLAVLMAKAGLFVPARVPVELPWFSQVLADIGDEQSIEQSLSTFSGHIRRIIRIVEALNTTDRSRSLVLLDEVGAGTDPAEGSALASAILRYLADQARLTIATTHFGELKALKYQDFRFENASVEFDEASLAPTYRLLWGIPGRSNALAIARRLGLDDVILAQAQTQIGAQSNDVNQVIAGLEHQRRQQEQKAQVAGQLLQDTEKLHQELLKRSAALQAREQQLQAEKTQAIQQELAIAKQEIAQVIRQLQKGPQTSQDAQRATETLNAIAQRHIRPPKPPKPSYMPTVGSRVRIPRLGQVAEVLTSPNPNGEFMVRFGVMKMTLSLTEVESLEGEKPTLPEPSPTNPSEAPAPLGLRTSRNTLDVRGQRVPDAEADVDRVISTTDETCVWIIHGHGTGRLRQGIHAFLQEHPRVASFQLAEREDGGNGVTRVVLR